jgi:hypothetical protein
MDRDCQTQLWYKVYLYYGIALLQQLSACINFSMISAYLTFANCKVETSTVYNDSALCGIQDDFSSVNLIGLMMAFF